MTERIEKKLQQIEKKEKLLNKYASKITEEQKQLALTLNWKERDAYMGKDYGGKGFELLSMGFAWLFNNPSMLEKDPEFRAWLFGVLLTK